MKAMESASPLGQSPAARDSSWRICGGMKVSTLAKIIFMGLAIAFGALALTHSLGFMGHALNSLSGPAAKGILSTAVIVSFFWLYKLGYNPNGRGNFRYISEDRATVASKVKFKSEVDRFHGANLDSIEQKVARAREREKSFVPKSILKTETDQKNWGIENTGSPYVYPTQILKKKSYGKTPGFQRPVTFGQWVDIMAADAEFSGDQSFKPEQYLDLDSGAILKEYTTWGAERAQTEQEKNDATTGCLKSYSRELDEKHQGDFHCPINGIRSEKAEADAKARAENLHAEVTRKEDI